MIKKTMSRRHGSSNCFRPPAAEPPSATTNLTTCLYHTRLGIFALTWTRTFLGRSLHLHLLPNPRRSLSLSSAAASSSFRLFLNSFLFWKKQGSHKLLFSSSPATILWDLTRAKFGSGPEPDSGFFIAVVVDSEIVLLVGDLHPSLGFGFGFRSGSGSGGTNQQALVVRREHVHGTKLHRTKTMFGGKTRAISIECDDSDPDPKLVIWVDDRKVVQVKHLKWKFRGSQRIDVDGQPILLSWDVYNWLFDDQPDHKGDSFALFTFRFEVDSAAVAGGGETVVVTEEVPAERGWRKKKGLRMKARSASSSSLSSAASSACGSVLEWESVEETELKGPTGFSLLVYAWKS